MFIKIQIKESERFLSLLKVGDSNEIGLTVALAANLKNSYLERGIDLENPMQLHRANPKLAAALVDDVRSMQKRNMTILAPGNLVWITSLRAANSIKLRALARDIWGELERGFPHAQFAADILNDEMGMKLNILGYEEFPYGLSPEPI